MQLLNNSQTGEVEKSRANLAKQSEICHVQLVQLLKPKPEHSSHSFHPFTSLMSVCTYSTQPAIMRGGEREKVEGKCLEKVLRVRSEIKLTMHNNNGTDISIPTHKKEKNIYIQNTKHPNTICTENITARSITMPHTATAREKEDEKIEIKNTVESRRKRESS